MSIKFFFKFTLNNDGINAQKTGLNAWRKINNSSLYEL